MWKLTLHNIKNVDTTEYFILFPNGDLKTDYYQYFGKRPPRQHQS